MHSKYVTLYLFLSSTMLYSGPYTEIRLVQLLEETNTNGQISGQTDLSIRLGGYSPQRLCWAVDWNLLEFASPLQYYFQQYLTFVVQTNQHKKSAYSCLSRGIYTEREIHIGLLKLRLKGGTKTNNGESKEKDVSYCPLPSGRRICSVKKNLHRQQAEELRV